MVRSSPGRIGCGAARQALRRLWLLVALLGAEDGAAPRRALGWLACVTPELAPTTFRQAALARIAAEMRPLLQALGPRATQPALQGSFLSSCRACSDFYAEGACQGQWLPACTIHALQLLQCALPPTLREHGAW